MYKRILIAIMLLTSTFSFSQNDTIKKLNEVTVSGVRAEKTAPVSEKTLNLDEISKTNVSFEPSNIINRTPSVTMSTDNGTPFGYTYFRIRGIDQTRINMTLNGVPLNEPEDQGVFFSNIPSFMENVESIQVQRGVGTTSNGTASFGGSINFRTADFTEKGVSMKLDLGSFNTQRLTSSFSTGMRGRFSLNVSGSVYSTNGYRYESGGSGSMLYLNTGYFWDKSSLKFTTMIGRSANEMAWLGVSESDINNNPRTNYNIVHADDLFTQSISILEFKTNLNKRSTFTSSVFYNRLNGEYDYDMVGTRNLSLSSNFYGVVNNLNVKLDKVTIDYGLSANDYTRRHSYVSDQLNNEGNKKEYASYLKLKLNLGKTNIFYDTQVRHTIFDYRTNSIYDIDKLHWTFINPKGGFNISIKPNSIFYYSVGLSHREPTRTSLFNGNDYLGNLDGDSNSDLIDLKPESVVDHELGYKYFSDKFTIKGNFFFMDYKNELIPFSGLLPNGVLSLSQHDKSYRKGIELDLDIKLSRKFTLSNNQTLMTSEIDNFNTQSVLTPNYISNTILTYKNKDIFVNLFNRIQSKSYIDITNDNSIGSFTTFDVNFGYSKNRYVSMLTIGNVTNQKYYTNGNMMDRNSTQTNIKHLFINSPINLFLTLKYKL